MIRTESRAIDVAKAHVDAWSKHDWEAARRLLSDDVKVRVTTTQPIMAPVDTVGADAYMEGLVRFGQAVAAGSARVLAATGDEHNALLLVTVKADFGAGQVDLPAARLYLLNAGGKIDSEQVVFYAAEP
jgi:SnoaL-like domain